MKITKLVILFNYKKILFGIFISLFFLFLSIIFQNSLNKMVLYFFRFMSFLIILNIFSAIIASYILYDRSDLYKLNKLKEDINLSKIENAVLIHASFDPLSSKLEKKYPNLNLIICDIFENRHEHDSGIKISKKVFPPHLKEIKIIPSRLPFKESSQDLILAITSVHEVLDHKERVLFFKEAKRILKKGGLIVVSEQFRDITNFIFFNIGAFHFLSHSQWKKAILESGLTIIKNTKITPFANILIIKDI